MVTQGTFSSPTFRRVANELVALHRLIKQAKDDSPEAEAIRDALDGPLSALSVTEKRRAQWLSEDLYSVSEPSTAPTPKAMDPDAQRHLSEALEARQRGQWDQALALLRQCKEYIAPALLSYVRGSIWAEAGVPEAATAFYAHALEGDPQNANYRAVYLGALVETDPDAALRMANDVLDDDTVYESAVVARAAGIRLDEIRSSPDAAASEACRRLIPILERNLARILNDVEAAGRASVLAMTCALLGFCHEFLGDNGAAVKYYSRGLQEEPDNDGLLVARGMLQYGTNPGAISDLERAVELRCPVVWPYLFLAHHYLMTGRYEECRATCEAGLRLASSPTAKSQLEEWRAMAQAELGFPPELVRAAFEAAVRSDPTNDMAKRNQDIFAGWLAAPQVSHRKWEHRPASAVRQLGLVERRYALAA